MSNEKFTCAYVANVTVSPKLIWMNNTRIRLKFKGSCLKQEDSAPFTENNIANLFVVYELDRWSRETNTDFTLKDCLFEALKITKNADPDKHKFRCYAIGFDSRSDFLFADGSYGKNAIIFGADMSSSVHVDNKGKDILNLLEGPTHGLDDTKLTAEGKYSINFSKSQRIFFYVYTIMEATVSYLLMLQKYISSKQMILK